MKILNSLAVVAFLFIASKSLAEVKSLNDLYAKAMADKTKTIGELSKEVTFEQVAEPVEGKQVMKVTRVEPGSKLDVLGLKPGDYVELKHNDSTLPEHMKSKRPLKTFPGLIKTH